MATRPIYSTTDKASIATGVAGNALSAELATQAFPESANKRMGFSFRPVAPPVGATPVELFIDGVLNFRFRLAERSTTIIRSLVTYNCAVAGSNVAFEITAAYQNVAGVITAIGTPTISKQGISAATLVITAVGEALAFTFTGVAGDTGGQLEMRTIGISEVTDLG